MSNFWCTQPVPDEDVENLKRHKFMEGTGSVYYNLFNWSLSSAIESKDIHLILP
jgi:hypothetical protein